MATKYAEAPEVEQIARQIIREHHPHLLGDGIRIDFFFRSGKWKAKGKTKWGEARKITDLAAFMAGHWDEDDVVKRHGQWNDDVKRYLSSATETLPLDLDGAGERPAAEPIRQSPAGTFVDEMQKLSKKHGTSVSISTPGNPGVTIDANGVKSNSDPCVCPYPKGTRLLHESTGLEYTYIGLRRDGRHDVKRGKERSAKPVDNETLSHMRQVEGATR